MVDRRTFLRAVGSATTLSVVAGCTSPSGEEPAETETDTDTETATATATSTAPATTKEGGSVTDVAVGPEKRLRFEPEEIEIAAGDTVRWTAKSTGHNVTSKPGASPKCENPDGAEPFSTYEGNDHFAIMEVGATFEHTFTVPGEYVYVCAPHAGQGMVGYITVTE